MSNFNKVILMGNLTRDPELRYTPANVGVATFTLVINSNIGKDADGTPKVETLFIDVIAFGKQAEAIAQYCKKGIPLFVEGRLRLRTWEDKEGNKRSKYEVVLNAFQFIGGANNNSKDEGFKQPEDIDEDIPF